MESINSVAMAGTRLAVLRAKEFPLLLALCANQDKGPVATVIIDHARDMTEANVKMYEYFERVKLFVEKGVAERHEFMERVAMTIEELFGECVFSIAVQRRDDE
jgi:hypothetical protein